MYLKCKNLGLIFAVTSILGACSEAKNPDTAVQKADRIFTNGKIYTLNPDMPWAEAVAISGEKFSYVGRSVEVVKFRGEHTQLINLNGKMAMPGLYDAHVHPVLAGLEKTFVCGFSPTATPSQIAARVSGCVKDLPEAQWIVGGRWNSNFFIEHDLGSPREWLDNISREKAISLQDDTGHNRWVNSKALSLAGIDKNSTFAGGQVVLDQASGEPNGLLLESAMLPILALIPERTAEDYQAVARAVLDEATQFGITGVKEAGNAYFGVRAYKALDDAGELNQHTALKIM